ncbi:MAG: SDR family oxidoreductase [bacterium]|nr:SDR family oxidoreductase [bacterium]
MKKIRILGTGLSGLVGSRVVELLADQYEFQNLSRETGFDIADRESTGKIIKDSNALIVLHLAAKTDVDGCEKDKEDDLKNYYLANIPVHQCVENNGQSAWEINVLGTKNIADACSLAGKRLIYISTDFVFDGERNDSRPYLEEDIPNPMNWYGQTKYEGEKIVKSYNLPWTILRIAYPYRSNFSRNDFVRTVIGRLKKGEKLNMVLDHVMSPTFIDDIAKALDVIVKTSSTGIFHMVGSQFVTPYEAASIIADIFNFEKSLVDKTTMQEFFANRAQRPFYLGLENDKIQKLGVKMMTFEEGIIEVKRQMSNF